MMPFAPDPRVDAYIDFAARLAAGHLPRGAGARPRRPDPDVEEPIKRTNRPDFVLHGNVCALLAAKDHVNVFLYDPIAPDPEGIVTTGHDNKTARTAAIRKGETINARALTEMFKTIIANNRVGGWRKLTETDRSSDRKQVGENASWFLSAPARYWS